MALVGVEIFLLGPPRVRRAGAPVAFDTRKATALLAHLAMAERPRSRDALCELLWPDQAPDRARGALRRTLSTLRKAIGADWIETSGDSVALLRGSGLELDVERFRELAPSDDGLADAAALFTGDFLEGFSLRDSAEFESWQLDQADELRRELGSVLARLVASLVGRGEYPEAIPYALRRLELDPLHEPAHRDLIRLYALAGERAAALDQYRACVRILSRELGVAPLEETAALFEQVSEGELAPPDAGRPDSRRTSAAPPPPGEVELVGRDAELRSLLGAYDGIGDDGRVAAIEGEAGIGKTRLASELANELGARGATVLSARCHEDEVGLPYGPVAELLRRACDEPAGWAAGVPAVRLADAGVLLPELTALDPEASAFDPPRGPEARARLMDGVVSVLDAATAGEEPGVLVVDDLHAADEATLDLILYLARRLRGRRLLLVLAWRSEALPTGHRLRRLTADLAREGSAVIARPQRLGADEIAELLDDRDTAQRIHAESEGLPLFVAEYLTVVRTAGVLPADALSGELRDLLRARLDGLPATARQVLGAAAVIGRSFGPETVRATSGRSEEETADALEQLVGRGVVGEGDQGYDFRHHKLRELVYDEVGLARRRLLHGRAASALAALPGSDPAIVAHHLRLAGQVEEAAAQYLRAADRAASLHAHVDALADLEAALALGAPDPAALHERMGDSRTLIGDYAGALAAYEAAAAHAPPEQTAALDHKVGEVLLRRGDRDRAEARLRGALETATDDGALRARIQADLSLALHGAGQDEEATTLAEAARATAEAAGDGFALAQAQNMLGVIARGRGDLDLAQTELSSSLELAERLGDTRARVAALNNLALAQRAAGELDAAMELTERALALCAEYGDRHREAALNNNLADLHHLAGREEPSMAALKRAVAIFSEVGGSEPERLPEVWKLVSW